MDFAVLSAYTEDCMEVAEHELGSWYVFTEGEDIYLDVRTGLFGYGFWLLLLLNQEEALGYKQSRKAFIKLLVQKILQRPHFYFMRNAPIEKQKVAFDALTAWRQGPRRPKV